MMKIAIGVGILKNMFHIVTVNLYGEAVCTETFEVPSAVLKHITVQ